MRFDDKAVLITGGGSGIGQVTAIRFAELGAQVRLADIDQDGLSRTLSMIKEVGGKASASVCDITVSADVQAVVASALQAYGKIDVMHCNAGIQGPVAPIYSMDEADFDRVMAVNTRGVFLGLRHVLPVMNRQGHGSVVVTCSIASLSGLPNLPAYVASKHAALGLVRSAAADVAPYGVRVNGVCPGAVDTPMLAAVALAMRPEDASAVKARFAISSPLGRLIQPREVADAVLFLSSDLALNITGTCITVDGGVSARVGSAIRST